MSVELRNLKGTKDFMPREQRLRNEIISKLREIFQCYGYQPLETPIICYYDILSSKYAGGAEILKEVYKFRDQGQRDVGLRYDLTTPLTRVIGMNPMLKLPFKRYEIGKVFRNGPVKTGRNREFIQCDVDSVGIKSIMAEAELMIMAADFYKSINLEVVITFNNRKLLSGLVRSVGISIEEESSAILTLDKLEKIGAGGVRGELLEKGIKAEDIKQLLDYLSLDEEALLNKLRDNPISDITREGIEELDQLREYIKLAKIQDICRFSPWLARGLEIYTGTVFEVFLKDRSISSSIGGGGRYDKAIGGFLNDGKEYPAVGITFGLDVIYEALVLKGEGGEAPPVDIYIIPIANDREGFKLLTQLRKSGIAADMEMNNRRVGKSLEYANKQGIPFVIFIGEGEVNRGRVKIKNMKTGEEWEAPIEEVIRIFD